MATIYRATIVTMLLSILVSEQGPNSERQGTTFKARHLVLERDWTLRAWAQGAAKEASSLPRVAARPGLEAWRGLGPAIRFGLGLEEAFYTGLTSEPPKRQAFSPIRERQQKA